MSSISEIREQELQLEILRADYDLLLAFARRRAAAETLTLGVVSDCLTETLARRLCKDSIPFLRKRLGLEPDPNLARFCGLFCWAKAS